MQSGIWSKKWFVGSRVHAKREMVSKEGSGGKSTVSILKDAKFITLRA